MNFKFSRASGKYDDMTEIDVNSLEELADLQKTEEAPLILDFRLDPPWITAYDDYLE